MLEITELDSIRMIAMNHGKVNAMDVEFCQRLASVLRQLGQDSACQAAILTSSLRVFCVGADLVRFLHEDKDYVGGFIESLEECFRVLFEFPKPIVAAINGHAVGGGCVLSSACDRRIISNQAKIGIPELRVGVPFPPMALEIMRWAASPRGLQPMINIGAIFKDEAAIEAGLADAVVAPETTVDTAIETTRQLLTIPTHVFTITKSQLRLPFLANAERTDRQFGSQIRLVWKSDQTRELIQDYVDQRL